MDDDKIQYLTRWLPEVLSPNVKVVLSMINDTECHRLLRSYKSGPREITCGQLGYNSRKVLYTQRHTEFEFRISSLRCLQSCSGNVRVAPVGEKSGKGFFWGGEKSGNCVSRHGNFKF